MSGSDIVRSGRGQDGQWRDLLGQAQLGGSFRTIKIICLFGNADLIDADEVETGHRKESLYFAVWKSGLKVARALAFVAIGLGLQAMGLDMSRDVVSESMQWGIVLLFGITVGLCLVVAAYFIWLADVPEPNET